MTWKTCQRLEPPTAVSPTRSSSVSSCTRRSPNNLSTWFLDGYDCIGNFLPKIDRGSFTPNWYSSTRTYDYIYDFTKNYPVKSPGSTSTAMAIYNSDEAYQNGTHIYSLYTEVDLHR